MTKSGDVAGASAKAPPQEREDWPRRLRRAKVPWYVFEVHGVIVAKATLAKLAVVGGGPEFELWGRIPYYPVSSLDKWVEGRLSLRRSTSDRGTAA